jgi:hypothetical protein
MVTVKELHEALEVLLALGHGDLGVAMTRTRRVDIAGCAVVLDGSSTYVEVIMEP